MLAVCLLAACGFESRARWQAQDSDTVRDSELALQWTRSDNGADIDWSQASAYCAALKLDGGGWTLPSTKQLLELVDHEQAGRSPCGSYLGTTVQCAVPAVFSLSGPFFWSKEPFAEHEAYGAFLATGTRLRYIRSARFNNRALCVRATPQPNRPPPAPVPGG